MRDLNVRYLERLSDLYPTIAEASTEVINLEAILNLPKGTEHFLTDIHGEYEAFSHVMKMAPDRFDARLMIFSEIRCAWRISRSWQRSFIIPERK